jgi:hypothetical protein
LFDVINWALGRVSSGVGFCAISLHAKEHRPGVTTIHLRSVALMTVRGRWNDAPGVTALDIFGGYGTVTRHRLGSEELFDECKS